jgi:hypothetical protein
VNPGSATGGQLERALGSERRSDPDQPESEAPTHGRSWRRLLHLLSEAQASLDLSLPFLVNGSRDFVREQRRIPFNLFGPIEPAGGHEILLFGRIGFALLDVVVEGAAGVFHEGALESRREAVLDCHQ